MTSGESRRGRAASRSTSENTCGTSTGRRSVAGRTSGSRTPAPAATSFASRSRTDRAAGGRTRPSRCVRRRRRADRAPPSAARARRAGLDDRVDPLGQRGRILGHRHRLGKHSLGRQGPREDAPFRRGTKPCMCAAGALRGVPASMTATRRRARPSTSAALRAAAPSPMTTPWVAALPCPATDVDRSAITQSRLRSVPTASGARRAGALCAQLGIHQFQSPARRMNAGTSRERITVTSSEAYPAFAGCASLSPRWWT